MWQSYITIGCLNLFLLATMLYYFILTHSNSEEKILYIAGIIANQQCTYIPYM